MTLVLPVEPGLVRVFASAVGDDHSLFDEQLHSALGAPIQVPLTYTRAVAEHFDVGGELRGWPQGDSTPEGGAPGHFHAEQHFEYFGPMRAGVPLTGHTYPGRTWTREGRSGHLEFGEMVTDFRDIDGQLVVRTRKVGVRVS